MLDALPPASGATVGLAAFVPLAAELCDLKRIRDASSPDSLATRMFRGAWAAFVAGDGRAVADAATADAVVACRLGGITVPVLTEAGVGPAEALAIVGRSFDAAAGSIEPGRAAALRAAAGGIECIWAGVPAFVEALIRQPRAGATCPGKARIVLEPPENHGEHCFIVAVLGSVLAPQFGADPEVVFVAGLAHHLHNASVPDSGFAGEVLLGEALTPLIARLFARELATLPEAARVRTEAALAHIADASTPEGRAFHAADVIDRVLQMRHFEDVARFRLEQALGDMELVHAGPTQAFHYGVLREAGLL